LNQATKPAVVVLKHFITTNLNCMPHQLHSKLDVLRQLEPSIQNALTAYLKPVEEIWHPSDLLPEASSETFSADVAQLQQSAKALPYDLIAVLVGDTITEEALPTYESWLLSLNNISHEREGGWNEWVRGWTAEENRHGDALNKYLYLSGRVNMKQMEISTHYLLADGFDIGTSGDPYRTFIYTSFQELATNISHRRVAQFAKEAGDSLLAKLCGNVASDEARHANAYKYFVSSIFETDPNQMMLAFEDMMRRKIVMPAHFLRESGKPKGQSFQHFSHAAQRLGVYTAHDYINILTGLITEWKIEQMTALSAAAHKARDYIMALPARLQRLAQRSTSPEPDYTFSWIYP
jgi:acyl-[acyl-carrier-protein] desaturase